MASKTTKGKSPTLVTSSSRAAAKKATVNVKAKTAAINAAKAAAKKATTPAKSTSGAKASSTAAKKTSTVKYNSPQYSDAYRKGIDTSFYTNSINDYTAQANAERQNQLGKAQAQQQAALRQAYINNAQSQLALNNSLAQQGIRGGATESSNLRLANQYGTAVGAANTDYANSVNQINQSIDQNIRDYTTDMRARQEEYVQNTAKERWNAAREDYANKFKAIQDADDRKYTRAQAERQWNTEYAFNMYNNLYSGYSKKKVKSIIKDLDKKIKKAKGNEKIRLQQQRAAAGARLGVIKNK